MKKLELHKKYTIFTGVMLSGYSMVDKMYGAVYIVLMSLKGISPFQISIIFAVASLSLAIFDYPSGNISDLFGRKKITSIGFFTWGLGLCLFGLSSSFILFIISAIIMSLGVSLISGSPQAWYLDKLNEVNKFDYKDIAYPKIVGFATAFSVVGALLASISSSINNYIPVVLGGLIAIALSLVIFIRFEDNYGSRSEKSIIKEIKITTLDFIKNKTMLIILLRNILSHGALLGFLLTWQVYGNNMLGLEIEFMGILLVLFMAVISLASFFTAFLTKKKVTTLTILVFGTVLSAMGLLLVGLHSSLFFFLVGLTIFEFGLGMQHSSYGAWVQDYIPGQKRATFYSGLTALQSLAGFFLALLIGYINQKIGYSFIWYFASLLLILSNIPVYYIKKSCPKEIQLNRVGLHE
ncbi:MFS transporter [Bacillus sp. SM2101]|uniref:MFS transporter n=1 Tax=Bacillus sp. SM2101 TaxID=2805366 RepID=UPI001BDE920A|nr:MFS transporter [Bacillus sp. SM2101]